MKSWSQDNYIEMNSTHNEYKSVVAERFVGDLKNKIYILYFDFNIEKCLYQ